MSLSPGSDAMMASDGTTQMLMRLAAARVRRRARSAAPSRRPRHAGCRRAGAPSLAGPHEHLAERPVLSGMATPSYALQPPPAGPLDGALRRMAAAASRTQRPSSCAARLPQSAGGCTGRRPSPRAELVPVDRPDIASAALLVPAGRIGDGETENLACGTVASTNCWRSSSLVKRLIFQPMDCSLCTFLVGRAEHHHRRPPPAVERVLRHRLLLGCAVRERDHDLETLALVEALLLADAHHGAGVGAVGAAADAGTGS